jgi:large subunit ribosomal protein L35
LLVNYIFGLSTKVVIMPKLKTKKAAAKRFRITGSGKIKRDRAGHEHIATKKSKNRKNRLKKGAYVAKGDRNNVISCLPNHRR